ncbi:copper chaperone PCu(A)C [Plastoroseomonas arctica]|uniref:Copper chaperone PCu(A)C n=1 Tax=Plastoroseomonas arctica TaxID=1509237 RepID=A0AAF1KJI9_9PROT|nr:copper chaperone PCu(A)C [Plastoroseomonas arctica]MBR0655245.1 copper chaperone PCu(A)C [Plastoroseomonas arctica]
MGLNRRILLTGLLASLPAAAQDLRQGDLVIGHPWTRAAGANGTGAGYLSIRNGGAAADRLLGASTPAARTVELHTMSREGEVMRMRPVTDIALPSGQTVTLAPGGLHIMLIGLTAPLAVGGEVPLTLRFERAGEVTVRLAVQAAGARQPAH